MSTPTTPNKPICNACKLEIQNYSLSCNKCLDLFDLNCLLITQATFEKLSQDDKESWVCPKCCSARPKTGNTLTPLRQTSGLNKTYTSTGNITGAEENSIVATDEILQFVNTNPRYRGASATLKLGDPKMLPSQETSDVDECTLSILYKEIIAIKNQNKLLLPLKKEISLLKQEISIMSDALADLKNALHERDKEIAQYRSLREVPIPTVKRPFVSVVTGESKLPARIPCTMSSLADASAVAAATTAATTTTAATATYAAAAAGLLSSGPLTGSATIMDNYYPIASTPAAPGIRRGRGIQKQIAPQGGDPPVQPTKQQHASNSENEGLIKTAQKIQRRRPIVIGSGDKDDKIKIAERTKYLQAWSFDPETTEESVKSYLARKACVDKVTVQKRTIKSEKHAAFVIGVPESLYDTFNDGNAWPPGVRVSQWFLARARRPERAPPTTDASGTSPAQQSK